MTLISDIINVLINTMVFLEDDDMYVRLLRLFSLNEFSSSPWRKTLSVIPSVREKFFAPYEENLWDRVSHYSS